MTFPIRVCTLIGLFLIAGARSEDVQVCSQENSVNRISGIPRKNPNFDTVSSDLGKYSYITTDSCNGGETFCPASDIELMSSNPEAFLDLASDSEYLSTNPESILNYISSFLLIAGVGVVFAAFSVLGGLISLPISCCCRRKSDQNPFYSRRSILCTYCILIIFLLTMLIMVGIIQKRGNAAASDVFLSLVTAPDSSASLVKGASDPFIKLSISLVGTAIPGLLTRVKNTVVDVVQIERVHASVGCVKEVLDFANFGTIDFFSFQLDLFEDAIVNTLEDLSNLPIIQTVTSQATDISSEVDNVVGILENITGLLDQINFTETNASVASARLLVSTIGGQLQHSELQLQSYDNITSSTGTTITRFQELLTVSYTQLSQKTNLVNAVNNLQNDLDTLPDENAIRTNLEALNVSIGVLDIVISGIVSELESYQGVVQGLPSVDFVNTTINALLGAIDALDFDAIEGTLLNITADLINIPTTDAVINKIVELASIKDKLPCILNATNGLIDRINNSLLVLPPEISQYQNIIDDLNQTIISNLGFVDIFLQQVEDFSNLTSLSGEINIVAQDFQNVFDAAKAQVNQVRGNIVTLQSQIEQFDPVVLNGTVASLIAGAQNARTSLTAVHANQTVLDEISSVNRTAYSNLVNDLIPVIASLPDTPSVDFFCASNPGTLCYDVSAAAPSVLPVTNTDARYLDICAPNFDCEFNWTYLMFAYDSLVVFAAEIAALDIPSILATVTNTKTQVQALDFTAILNDLSPFPDYIANLEIAFQDTLVAQQEVKGIINDLGVLDFDLSLSGQLNATFNQLRDELTNVNESLVGYLETVQDGVDVEEYLYQFLTEDFDEIMQNISSAKLLDILDGDNGMQSLVQYFFDQLDNTLSLELFQSDVISDFGFSLGNGTDVLSVSERKTGLEIGELLDMIRDTNGELTSKGSIYYLLSIVTYYMPVGINLIDDVDDNQGIPIPFGYIKNQELINYPNSSYCALDACIENLIKYIDGEQIEGVASLFGIELPVAVPVTRQQISALPFIAPVFIILVGIMVFFLPCCCGSCLSVFAICCSPWLFLCFGSLAFPLVVLLGDTCAGLESLSANILQETQPVLCVDFLNGTLDPQGLCVLSFDTTIDNNGTAIATINETVTIDAAEILESLLGGCAGKSTANSIIGNEVEPVKALYDTIPEKAIPIVSDLIDYITSDLGPYKLRPPLVDAVDGVNGDIASSLTNFASDLNRAFGCEPVTAAYLGFKDVVCCDFLSVVYYNIWPWYLMAFALLFCGFPAGCCARTRLRNIKKSREVVMAAVIDGQDSFQAVIPIARTARSKKKKRDDIPPALSADYYYSRAREPSHVEYNNPKSTPGRKHDDVDVDDAL